MNMICFSIHSNVHLCALDKFGNVLHIRPAKFLCVLQSPIYFKSIHVYATMFHLFQLPIVDNWYNFFLGRDGIPSRRKKLSITISFI